MTSVSGADSKRIEWIDALKALGIFWIFLGHLEASAGRLYPFAFSFHVPLFFLISGIFARSSVNKKFIQTLFTKMRLLLLPYCIFSAISILMYCLCLKDNYQLGTVLGFIRDAVYGIRNQTPYAPSLWFLPCMFVVSMLYDTASRILKNRMLVGGFCVLAYIVMYIANGRAPGKDPSWIFSADSACFYIIYYWLGDVASTRLKTLTGIVDARRPWVLFTAFSCTAFAVFIYVKGMGLQLKIIGLNVPYTLEQIALVPAVLLLIYLNCVLAFILSRFNFVRSLGQKTLELCCVEAIARTTIVTSITFLGLPVNIYNPFSAVLFTLCTLSFAYYYILPWATQLFAKPHVKVTTSASVEGS